MLHHHIVIGSRVRKANYRKWKFVRQEVALCLEDTSGHPDPYDQFKELMLVLIGGLVDMQSTYLPYHLT